MTRLLLLLPLLLGTAHADPKLTSWYTAQAGKYARIQETDAEAVAGTSKTTWTRTSGPFTLAQTTPAYAGPTQIDYSTNWVYVRTPSLGTYTMGPWYDNAAKTQLFINVPKNQGLIIRIPRAAPVIPATKTQINGLNVGGVMQPGAGYYVDGVAMYDPTDGFSYSGGSETSPGTGQWHRDAYVNESITFDYSMAHQQNTGFYHNHANPLALRYQLGDAVSFNSSTKKYAETMSPTAHSPIVAWMIDGLPVYGPYGYGTAMDANSGVRRMVGGFVKRDGTTTGVDNITTAGRTLPAWMLRNNGNTSAAGPAVNATYPMGRYIQDWAYLGDLQKSAGVNYQQGVDFDLNEYNVRYCVTPEFPSGTWAYFVNISSTGTPQFPYMCNRWFYGTPTGGKVNSITETVTSQFVGGPSRPLTVNTPSVSGTSVTMTWNAVEGGTYSVDASTNGTTWTNKATGLTVSNANTKSNTHTALRTSGTEQGRVQRTALATYDTTGVVTPTVSQTATTSYNLGTPPTAPTLTTISALVGATEDTAFTISYASLAAAADEADANGDTISFRIESVLSGTLTKNGNPVSAGSALISTGESVVWTPGANENGTLAAFTVKAWDGSLASSSAVTVNVQVTSVADSVQWDGSAGTGDWATAANWLDNAVPASGDVVNFTGAAPLSIGLGAERSIAGLSLSGNSAYNFSGGSFILAEGGSLVTADPSAGTIVHSIGSPVSFQGSGEIATSLNANLQITGNLTASSVLTKSGAGKLVLGGTASAVEVRVEQGGILHASGGTASLSVNKFYVGSATTTGILTLTDGAGLSTADIQLGISGGGTGTLNISGAGTTVAASGFIYGNDDSTVSIFGGGSVSLNGFRNVTATVDNGKLMFNQTTYSSANFVIASGGATMGASSDSANLTGTISGSGDLTVSGAGELQITGTHTRTGNTIVQDGTLRMASASLDDGADVSIASNAKLDLFFTGYDAIGELFIGGVRQVQGTWGSLSSNADHKTYRITGTGILVVTQGPTAFENWTATNGLTGANAQEGADPDQDGLANVLEWLLGGNPTANDAGSKQLAVARDGGFLTVTFPRSDDSEAELDTYLQYTTDFVTWTDLGVSSADWTAADGSSLTITENGSDLDTITVKIPIGGKTKIFVRLASEIE
ncbi:YHYH protein [Luteolibacter soli]|uniref:YHYH protein n=1 Tax=Luteolibacter soli TaxID=3135280 RepID=A0ABU9ARE0_9BACT